MSAELHRAIDNHDLDTLARLLAAGHDPDEIEEGWAPLHNAMGDLEAVALLLRHGANPNVWDRDRYVTPLLTALFGGYRDAALMLLAAGADPNVKNCVGDFPLLMCAEQGDLKMAATLLRAGATKTMEESGGCGAGMMFCLSMKSTKIALCFQATVVPFGLLMASAMTELGCAGAEQHTPPPQQPVDDDDGTTDPYVFACESEKARGNDCLSKAEWCAKRGMRPAPKGCK